MTIKIGVKEACIEKRFVITFKVTKNKITFTKKKKKKKKTVYAQLLGQEMIYGN